MPQTTVAQMSKTNCPIDLEIVLNAIQDAVYLIDPETSNIIWCNQAGYEDLGLDAHEVLNHSVLSLQKDVTGLPQWTDVASVIKSQPSFTFVGRHRHHNGGEIAVEVKTRHFEHQGQSYFLSVARNINQRMALEKDMNNRNHSIWFALNEASDGIWEWELENNAVFFSPQLKKMLGYGPDEMAPTLETWINNVHPEDLVPVKNILDQHLQGFRGKYEVQYRLKNRNGHYIWVHDQGRVCQRTPQGEPTHVVGMVKNITDQKMLEQKLENLASFDLLTNLPNRQNGEQKAQQLIHHAQITNTPLCLIVVDLDHFKQINDLHGHLKGDEVLVLCAHRLKSVLRRTDLIYRWGGEEFVIVLPETDLKTAAMISQKLHDAFATADWQQMGITSVTLSIGISELSSHINDLISLFNQADLATYQAKSLGRNQTVLANTNPPITT